LVDLGINLALEAIVKVKVAIPVWDGRVSPVMDTARRLIIVEIVDGREVSREIVEIPQTDISHSARFISGLGIDDLVCGAVSHQFEQMLTASGIRTRPWFCGDVDDIIAAHSNGTLQNSGFFSPGCGRRRRRGKGRFRKGRAGFGQRRLLKEDQ
jgi:predicted Fe-Mo cluster-binding NifX family protein